MMFGRSSGGDGAGVCDGGVCCRKPRAQPIVVLALIRRVLEHESRLDLNHDVHVDNRRYFPGRAASWTLSAGLDAHGKAAVAHAARAVEHLEHVVEQRRALVPIGCRLLSSREVAR
jgi:hypothetical protein